jgi:transcriptional regulator with XRE-family HTH domain
MLFADKLRELRMSKGWSQKELAQRAGVSQQGLTQWETGGRNPNFPAVISLCRALGVHSTIFEDCEFREVEEKRGRGRPTNADAMLAYEHAKTKEAKAATKKKASKKR